MSLILLMVCTCACLSTVKGDFWHVETNEGPKCFQVVFNMNAVADKIITDEQWNGTTSTTFYFGKFSHWENCSNACAQTPGCASWALHGIHFNEKWRKRCYGVDLENSQNKKEDNIISGVQITCSSTGLSLDQKCPTTNDCPLGWIKFGDNCYLLVNHAPSSITFRESQHECKREGGFLASIHSPEEKYFLMQLHNATLTTIYFFWIGLLGNLYNDQWNYTWTDSTDYNFTLEFKYDYPSNIHQYFEDEDEDEDDYRRAGFHADSGQLMKSDNSGQVFAGYICKKGM